MGFEPFPGTPAEIQADGMIHSICRLP